MKTMCIETNPLSSSTPPHTRAHSSPHTCRLLCCSAPLSSSPTPHPHHTHISPTLQPPIVIHRHPPSPIHQPLTLNHSPSPTLLHSYPLSPTLTPPAPHRLGRDHRHNIPCQGHARVQLQRKGHDRRGRRQVCLRGWTLVWAGHSNNCPRALPPRGGAGVPVRGESLRFSTIITFSLYHGWENMYTDN